jgi:hypothetical protein
MTFAAAATLAAMGAAAPASAGASALSAAMQAGGADAAIERSFRSALGRAPSRLELARYRALMIRNGWTEQDVRQDLGARDDYRKFSNDTSQRPAAAIRSAYRDILGRDPDREGLRAYRQKMVREGWTEQDVRDELRRSPEYQSSARRTASADRIIRRAYRDVLNREPDPEGLAAYRHEVIENGWEYHDLRQVLARSEEARGDRRDNRRANRRDARSGVNAVAEADEMVRRAYRNVLGREVDDVGLREYSAKVLNEGWTEARVAQALRESPEYRNRNR